LAGYTGEHCDTNLPEVPKDFAREHSLEMRIRKEWRPEYADKNSKTFLEMATLLKNEIQQVYSGKLKEVIILSFRRGSIVAKFKLVFKADISQEEASAPLKKQIEDGELGILKVDPASLKTASDEIQNTTNEPTKESETKFPFPVVIGAACGGAFVLCLVTYFVIRQCKREGKENPRRAIDFMPSEVAFPDAEKYELKDTKPRDDVGFWNKAAME